MGSLQNSALNGGGVYNNTLICVMEKQLFGLVAVGYNESPREQCRKMMEQAEPGKEVGTVIGKDIGGYFCSQLGHWE